MEASLKLAKPRELSIDSIPNYQDLKDSRRKDFLDLQGQAIITDSKARELCSKQLKKESQPFEKLFQTLIPEINNYLDELIRINQLDPKKEIFYNPEDLPRAIKINGQDYNLYISETQARAELQDSHRPAFIIDLMKADSLDSNEMPKSIYITINEAYQVENLNDLKYEIVCYDNDDNAFGFETDYNKENLAFELKIQEQLDRLFKAKEALSEKELNELASMMEIFLMHSGKLKYRKLQIDDIKIDHYANSKITEYENWAPQSQLIAEYFLNGQDQGFSNNQVTELWQKENQRDSYKPNSSLDFILMHNRLFADYEGFASTHGRNIVKASNKFFLDNRERFFDNAKKEVENIADDDEYYYLANNKNFSYQIVRDYIWDQSLDSRKRIDLCHYCHAICWSEILDDLKAIPVTVDESSEALQIVENLAHHFYFPYKDLVDHYQDQIPNKAVVKILQDTCICQDRVTILGVQLAEEQWLKELGF